MKITELAVGSRFRYQGQLFVKVEGNLARKRDGTGTLFPSDAEVELIKGGPSRTGHQGSSRAGS
jgi:hypothetical protein